MPDQQQEALFRRWLDEHLGLMLKVVRAFAATPQDQEDLFQETLLQLWRSVPAFRGEAKETTWIYRVAFNTALAWNRSEKKRKQRHENFLQFDLPLVLVWVVVFWGVYRLNQFAVQKTLEPRRQELNSLLSSLNLDEDSKHESTS